jgi:hypothetical protein
MAWRNLFRKKSEAEEMCDKWTEMLEEMRENMLRLQMKIADGRRAGMDVSDYEQMYLQHAAMRDEGIRQLNFWLHIWRSEL